MGEGWTPAMTREEWEESNKEYYELEVFGYINDQPPEQLAWEKKQDRRHKLRPHVPSWLHRQKVPF